MRKTIIISLSFAFVATQAAAQESNPCVDFFSISQKDVRTIDVKDAAFASTYDQICRGTNTSRKSSASIGFTIASAPLNFSGMNEKQKSDTFCAWGATQNWSKTELTGRDEIIVRESFQAFNACMALREQKVVVSPVYAAPTSLVTKFDNRNFDMKVGIGVESSSRGKISCYLQISSKEPTKLKNASKLIVVEGEPFSVSCQREASSGKNKRMLYDRATIVLTTTIRDAPPLPIVMPAYAEDAAGPTTEQEAQIARLRMELSSLKKTTADEIERLKPITAKSYVITSNMSLPIAADAKAWVRDLRSADLEPAAPCDGRTPWGQFVFTAAKKLCERDGLIFKGDPQNIFSASGAGCGRTAFIVGCATR